MPNESAKIILAATHGKLTKVRDDLAVKGTVNALKVEFQFRTEDWNNTTKTAVFVRGRATPSTSNADIICVLLDDSNECNVPPEILAENDVFSVGAYGSANDYRIVSNWIFYCIADGCYYCGKAPSSITPDIYEQLLIALKNKSDINHGHDDRYYTQDAANEKFLTAEDLPTIPVTSVNKKTGDVVLNAGDVGAFANSVDKDGKRVPTVPYAAIIDPPNLDGIAKAEEDIEKLETKVETHTTDIAGIKEQIKDLESNTYDDSELRDLIAGNTKAIDVLNGTGEGSVDRKIDDKLNEFATNVTDDGVVNSYKELIDYAAAHGPEFTALVGEVSKNTEAISANEQAIADINNSAIKTVNGMTPDENGNVAIEVVSEIVPSDWNQNDETQSDYIKNRTHYVYEGTVTIFTKDIDIVSGNNIIEENTSIVLTEGETYTVVFDNATYECEAKPYTDLTGTSHDLALVGVHKYAGDYFFIHITDGNLCFFNYYTKAGTYLLEVSKTAELVSTLDEKYIPDTIARISDIPNTTQQVQSDWSQNDQTATDYVKNRTHWVDQVREMITDVTTIEGESPIAYDYENGLKTDYNGKSFTITWDGVDYDCAVNVKYGMSSYYYCGNGSLYSSSLSDTGEPFCFYISKGAPKIYYASGTSHIYKIIGDYVDNVHQLDEKYIPDTIARTENVPENPVKDIEAVGQDFVYTNDDGMSHLVTLITTGVKFRDRSNGYYYMVEMYDGNLVTSCCCTSIYVTAMPTKTDYMIGDEFDPSGMVITANCEDGSTKIITDYEYTQSVMTGLIEISYLEDGKTYSTAITVSTTEFDAATVLVDFEYTSNDDGTYTITGWKGTLNGVESTECVVPNNALIIV